MKKMLAVAVLFSLIFSGSPALAAPAKFANCSALLKKYPNGVAMSAKSTNKGNGPIAKPKVDAGLYNANKKLDTDKDGILCEKVVKAAAPSQSEVTGAGLDGINKDSWKIAQAAVLKAVASGTSTQANFSFVVGPKLDTARLASRKTALDSAYKLWSKWFAPVTVEAIYWSENDAAWAEEKLATGWNYRPNLQAIAAGERGNCGSAGANGDGRSASFHECVGTNLENIPSSVQTTPHEYTHLFQNRYGGCALYDWYCEGGAAYFGSTVGNVNDTSGAKRLAQLRLWSNNLGEANKASIAAGDKQTVIRLLTEWQGGSHTRDAIAGSYFLGNLATEVLVAAFGVERWAEFTISLAGPNDFDYYFKKSFGVETQTFYKIVADYVAEQPEIFR